MRYTMPCIVIFFISLCGWAAAQAEKEVPILAPDDFAILPWGWTPGDLDTLKTIRECGFNLAGFVAPENLDAVNQAGLKCIVSDPSMHVGDAEASLDPTEVTRRVNAVANPVAGHPAVYGYYLRDEPSAARFPGLRVWSDACKNADPDATPYINLLPTYASVEQLGAPTYAAYLESFIQTVRPRFISYDHYALMDDGSLRHGYFQNLEAVRAAALAHDLPFWNIVLSNAHFNYATPSDAGLRFQLYTTLAYGGRGISYFTYFSPEIGNYRLAPIDQFGHKTPTWDMLRNVNLQLHRIGPLYLTLKSVNVFHHPEVPEGCAGIATSRFLDTLEGGDMLAGEFEGFDGRPWVLLVNKSLQTSIRFNLKFKENGTIERLNPYSGNIEAHAGENDWLAAGQGVLLGLKR